MGERVGERGSDDVLVVGGGTAGAVVAARLAAAGATVTVLEAGPDYGALAEGRWPADLLDAAALPTSHDWGFAGAAADGRRLLFDRARVIGGCSAHNGSTMSLGWRADWDALPAGWGATALAPSFAAAQQALRVRVPGDDEVQPFQRAFLDGCAAVGVARTDDLLDVDGGVGVSVNPVNIVDGVRWNSAVAYLDPVRHLANLRVVGDAEVLQVVLEGAGRARGVQAVVAGEVRTFAADLVVLAAGAYGTPVLLQRSGIGPAGLLADAGIEPRVHLAGVGAGLQDHPVLCLELAASAELIDGLQAFRAATGFLPEEQCVAKVDGGSADAPYDLHVFPWVEPDPVHGWRCVFPVGLVRPQSVGEVRATGAGPDAPVRVDHAYLREGADVERLLAGLAWMAELVRTPALAPLLGEVLLGPPPGASRSELVAWARATHRHYWHPTGGACLGADADSMAVCDAAARVRGVEGLVVADASLLPRVPRCTPALPVTAIGEHVAGLLSVGGR